MEPDYNNGVVPYVNTYNYNTKRPIDSPTRYEAVDPDEPSMTQPGEELSIADIMRRAQGGITEEERN